MTSPWMSCRAPLLSSMASFACLSQCTMSMPSADGKSTCRCQITYDWREFMPPVSQRCFKGVRNLYFAGISTFSACCLPSEWRHLQSPCGITCNKKMVEGLTRDILPPACSTVLTISCLKCSGVTYSRPFTVWSSPSPRNPSSFSLLMSSTTFRSFSWTYTKL